MLSSQMKVVYSWVSSAYTWNSISCHCVRHDQSPEGVERLHWLCFAVQWLRFWFGRGEGTLLYKPYRYVPPHRVGFLHRFGLKTGTHFAHFGLELGMVFEGTMRVYERIYRFNSKWVRKKEKYANLKWFCIIFLVAL